MLVLAWLFLLPRVEPGRNLRLRCCRFHKQKSTTCPKRVKDVAEKLGGSRQAEPMHGIDGHHDIIVACQITPPVWFRQITHERPPAYTITTIDRAAQRDKEQIPIHEINLRLGKSGMNGAACIASAAAHVPHPQALAGRKWNRCGDQLERAWLGGALLRAPQLEPYVEIFAAKFVFDFGLSRDFRSPSRAQSSALMFRKRSGRARR